MARAPKTLRVVANPFVHLDHDGRPAAVVAFEPNPRARGTELKRFHGAALHATVIEERVASQVMRGKIIPGDDRKSVHDHTFAFSYGDEIVVPDTRYYREQLTPGLSIATPLLPADEATAKKLGIPFRDPKLTIAETAEIAAKHWADANDGEEPEFLTVDLGAEDAKIAAKQPSDVHPAHRAAARFLRTKANPAKKAERVAQAADSDTFKAKLEAKAKGDADMAKKIAEDAAKRALVLDLAPPKGPSVLEGHPTTVHDTTEHAELPVHATEPAPPDEPADGGHEGST